MLDNVRTVFGDLPNYIQGFTIYSDDYYTIYINAGMGYYGQRKTLEHELRHVVGGDFCSDKPLEVVE